MKLSFDKLLFYLCLAFLLFALSFAYGYLCHKYKLFPHHYLHETKLALKAIWDVYTVEDRDVDGVDFMDSEYQRPVANHLSTKAGKENIFILSNEFAFRKVNQTGCFAWIMDRNGTLLHVWKNLPNLWAPLAKRDSLGDNWRAYPVGAYLYPNGDLLVSYQGKNVFPMSMGLAKFDKDSNLLWKNDGYYHHWFDVDRQGRIFVPTHKIVSSPLKIPDNQKYFECKKEKFTYDTVSILSPDGKLLEEIDLFDSIIRSDLAGVFHNCGSDYQKISTCDPMHLNDIRITTARQAATSSRLNPGDLLLSFRSLNAVAVLDHKTQLFKWFHVGASHNQHSPRWVKNDKIFVFDNLGGRKSQGTSRVVSIDFPSGKSHTVFPKDNIEADRLFSRTAGYLDIHPSGERMLVATTHKSTVREIDIPTGKILWEYINTHPIDQEKFGRITIMASLYCDHIDFGMNRGR